jgi:hypothetical protein
MELLCCTSKYRKVFRLPERLPEPVPPTSRLGPWYANTLNPGRSRFLHYTSAPSRLAVIIPRSPYSTAEARFSLALGELLTALGVSAALVAAECANHATFVHTRATDRSVLGTMRDQGFAVKSDLDYRLATTPLDLMRRLAETPCGPLGYRSPERVAPRLLQDASPA